MFPVARLEAPGGQAPAAPALQTTQLVGSGTVKGGHVKRWKISFGWSKWWRLERLKRARSKIHKSKPLKSPLPVSENRELVDNILSVFNDEIETQFLLPTPGCGDLRRIVLPPWQHGDLATISVAV